MKEPTNATSGVKLKCTDPVYETVVTGNEKLYLLVYCSREGIIVMVGEPLSVPRGEKAYCARENSLVPEIQREPDTLSGTPEAGYNSPVVNVADTPPTKYKCKVWRL